MAVSLAAFLPLVKAITPAVPNPVAEQQLRLAAHEFFTRTKLWRQVITVAVTANPFTIAPAYTSVVGIEQANFATVDLEMIPFGDIALDTLGDTGFPYGLTESAPDEFRLVPFEAGDLIVSAYLTVETGPRFGASGPSTHQSLQAMIPDFAFKDHADTIAHGAVARIMRSPNQPYSDINSAMLYGSMFQKDMDDLCARQITGKHRARARTRASYF